MATTTTPVHSSRPAFVSVRVIVSHRASATGGMQSRVLTHAMLGGRGGQMPFLCASHQIDFKKVAAVKRYAARVATFFSLRLLTAATAPTTALAADKILEYNFANMLNLFFPTSFPNKEALHGSSPTRALPPLGDSYTAEPFSYLLTGGGGAVAGGAAAAKKSNKSKSKKKKTRPTTTGRRRRRRRAAPTATNNHHTAVYRSAMKSATRRRSRHLRGVTWDAEVARIRTFRKSESPLEVAAGGAFDRAFDRAFEQYRAGGQAQGQAEGQVEGGAGPSDALTVFRTTWLNDARNHPVYATLIRTLLQYNVWFQEFRKPTNGASTSATNGNNVEMEAFLTYLHTAPAVVGAKFYSDVLMRTAAPQQQQQQQQSKMTLEFVAAVRDLQTEQTFDERDALDVLRKKYAAPAPPAPPAPGESLAQLKLAASAAAAVKGATYGQLEAAAEQCARSADVAAALLQLTAAAPAPGAESARAADAMDRLTQVRDALAAAQRAATQDPALARLSFAMQALAPLFSNYQQVSLQIRARAVLNAVDLRYAATQTPDLAAYVTANYPQFVELVGVLSRFSARYKSSNAHWEDLVRRFAVIGDGQRTFRRLVAGRHDRPDGSKEYFRSVLQALADGENAGSTGPAGAAAAADLDNVQDYLQIGLDTLRLASAPPVVSAAAAAANADDGLAAAATDSPMPLAGGAAAAGGAASAASAAMPTVEAYIQVDVVGRKLTPETADGAFRCGFRDFHLGVLYDAYKHPMLDWQVPRALFF